MTFDSIKYIFIVLLKKDDCNAGSQFSSLTPLNYAFNCGEIEEL